VNQPEGRCGATDRRPIANVLAQEIRMPSKNRVRSMPTPAVFLAGAAAFAVGLFSVLSSTPSHDAYAQGDCTTPDAGCPFTQNTCTQPSESGCPIALDATVTATLSDATVSHNWLLNVTDSADFTVYLTNLPANYQLWVYGPDGSLLGLSNNDGTTDEKIVVPNKGVGTYWVTVNSQNGDVNASPYTMYSSTVAATTVIPIASYEAPVPARFGSYRTAP